MISTQTYSIQQYDPVIHKDMWNKFVAESKNATFLFHRNFMDYHKDRFCDYSLCIFNEKNKLMVLFPANVKNDIIYSHEGLTYGGLLYPMTIRSTESLKIFDSIISYYQQQSFKKIIYKPIPYIYHKQFAEEDRYALFKHKAKCIRTDLASCIQISNYTLSSRTKRYIKFLQKKQDITVEKTTNVKDYQAFFDILKNNLNTKHHTNPVHTVKEMLYLQDKFPDNIELWILKYQSIIQAGCWVFKAEPVYHTQYGHAVPHTHYLPFLYHHILKKLSHPYLYFDFGISTTDNGQYLNEDLLFAKESLGARSYITKTYEIIL